MSPSLLQCLSHRIPYLRRRAALLRALREFFQQAGFTEIETPLLLTTVAPEEHIVPVGVGGAFLATSPELQMKQLVAAGLAPIYQLVAAFVPGNRAADIALNLRYWNGTGSGSQLIRWLLIWRASLATSHRLCSMRNGSPGRGRGWTSLHRGQLLPCVMRSCAMRGGTPWLTSTPSASTSIW